MSCHVVFVNTSGGGVVQELQRGDPQRVGPYRLVGRLGSGGMGRVFLGRSAGRRLVAVKVIRDELAADPDFRMRFGREVAAARRVGGLFTALVVDADADAPTPWLATAYVAGPSLADAVSKSGPLPPASVLSVAAGLAEGLGAIHAAGLVHRDLKPSNVLLAEDGPRVIDFGISRAAEASALTRTGGVLGSPGFMSPEQAEGHEVGPASDVFSLGAVLVHAATGVPPFGTGSTAALIYRVVFSPPRLDDVPWQVRPIAERCLAKDPCQRPTPAELLAEFGDVDLAAAWLPTRVREGFAQHLSTAPASVERSAPYALPERAAQPDSPAAPPDAPDTVTGLRYQPEEPPTAEPARAAKGAQPRPADLNPSAALTANHSTAAPEPTTPAAAPATRPPIREGAAYTGAVIALLAGIAGFISTALYHVQGASNFFDQASNLIPVVVAIALMLLPKHRLVIIGLLLGILSESAAALASNIVWASVDHGLSRTSHAAYFIGITSDVLGVIAAILLIVSWSPAADRRRVPMLRALPVMLLCSVILSMIADFVFFVSLNPDAYGYTSEIAGFLVGLAVTWYALTLRARLLGSALVLGWVTIWALALFSNIFPWSSISGVEHVTSIVECILLAVVVILAIVYMRGSSDTGSQPQHLVTEEAAGDG